MTEIITADRRMQELMQLAKTVAPSKATVLIQGESGTGKELMASLIHRQSTRATRPFVAINCAAIPDNLLESELFGHERGAFTGALNAKSGKFELAHGGTLLLDEISEMDIRLQAKLLRAIQQGEVDRIGGRAPVTVDVRIIATTNRNLADCVRDGTFREDLFYRLNVVNLTLPPLRERVGDVGLVARYFAERAGANHGKGARGLSEAACARLETHGWPGNLRELENVIERAIITCAGAEISAEDLASLGADRLRTATQLAAGATAAALGSEGGAVVLHASAGGEKGWAPGQTLDDIERRVILTALSYHQGNRTHTAKALGISIRTLRNKLADYRQLGIHA